MRFFLKADMVTRLSNHKDTKTHTRMRKYNLNGFSAVVDKTGEDGLGQLHNQNFGKGVGVSFFSVQVKYNPSSPWLHY